MAARQGHGKVIEDLIKGSGMFPGACDAARPSTAEYDIEEEFDKESGLATSVKVSSTNSIPGADACRFFASLANDIHRLLFAPLTDDDDRGEWCVTEIHEYLLGPHMIEIFFGDVSFEEILSVSQAIKAIPPGPEQVGRDAVDDALDQLKPRLGLIKLNPKLDSKNQRRLQCSFLHSELEQVAAELGLPKATHDTVFGRVVLPLRVVKSDRLKENKSLLSRDSLNLVTRAPKRADAARVTSSGFSSGHLDHVRKTQSPAAA